MNRPLTERLRVKGLWQFEGYVRDYLTMPSEGLAKYMARHGVVLTGDIPEGVIVALAYVHRSDGTQLDSRAVLSSLLETGLHVYDWALNQARVIPQKEFTFSGWSPYDEKAEESLPEVPFVKTGFLARVTQEAKAAGMDLSCLPVAAVIAGIAHSLGFFPDDLREWAADITVRTLNLADDVLMLEILRK